jgi:hypothetical protein
MYLYISEYSDLMPSPMPGQGPLPIPLEREAPAEQVLLISAESIQSFPFQPNTRLVRLHCEDVCLIVFGPNPTASQIPGRGATDGRQSNGIQGRPCRPGFQGRRHRERLIRRRNHPKSGCRSKTKQVDDAIAAR